MDGLRYRLSLDLAGDSLEYRGRVVLDAEGFPSPLVLDTIGHSIVSVSGNGKPLRFEHNAAAGTLTLPEVPAGLRAVVVEYQGAVDDRGLHGFCATPLGPGRLYSTYFEPAAARRLLPCFDRPDAKGTFVVEVTGPASLAVISNMPAETTEALPRDRRRIRFAATPRMSTYLLFLGIGPLEELRSARNAPELIVATAPGRSGEGRFALDEGSRTLDFFLRYFGEPFPLPKLHLLAIPQFGTGAMENWGAIAFQEHYLLLDENTPISSRMQIVRVLAHEIAHQWFGDLVTMRDWTDLWLNESFATFVGTKAVEALHPEWKVWEEFLGAQTAGSMLWDALPHTHPVRMEVTDPELIRQIFDEISYGKGASVLRMGEAYVGEEQFRRGVSAYLASHRWANATSADLWRALAAASRGPADRVLSEWVDRPGYPVVRVRREGRRLRLDQRRFSLLGPVADRPWPIPITVQVGDASVRHLFDGERAEVELPSDGLPLVNPGRTGYYRVQYDGPLREQVLGRFSDLPPIDRWALLNDGLALFLSGATDLEDYLELLGRLEADSDPFVLSEAASTSLSLFPLIHRIPRWEDRLRRIVVLHSERLGTRNVAGEPDRVRHVREQLTAFRVRLDPAFAASLATEYPGVDALEPEFGQSVLSAYAAAAGPEEYAELRARLARASSAEVAAQTAAALGSLPRDEWLRESLELFLTGGLMLGPWVQLFGAVVVSNPDRSEAVRRFLVERTDALAEKTAGTEILAILLQLAVPLLGLADPSGMRAWTLGRAFPDSQMGVTKGLDLLEAYARALERSGGHGPTPPNVRAGERAHGGSR